MFCRSSYFDSSRRVLDTAPSHLLKVLCALMCVGLASLGMIDLAIQSPVEIWRGKTPGV